MTARSGEASARMPWMEVIMGKPVRGSAQAEHVLHVVNAGRFLRDPGGGAHGAAREDAAVGGLVGELQTFAERGEHDGVVADDVAAAQGVDADLGGGAFAGDALAAVAERVVGVVALFAVGCGESG